MKKVTLFRSVAIVFFLLLSIIFIQTVFAAQNHKHPVSGDYVIELYNLWNDGTCYSSSYSITNLSSIDPAEITHYFYIEGLGIPVVTYLDPLPLLPSETRIYDLVAIPDLPTDFLGYVVIHSDQPITDEVLLFPPCDITVSGPPSIKINNIYTFTAYITPEDALLPITYTWIATDHQPVKHTSGISDSVEFSWSTGDWKQISIYAENSRGSAIIHSWLYITEASKIFLPITLRNQ